MSRTNKPRLRAKWRRRGGGGHGYQNRNSTWKQWAKKTGNQRMRHHVHTRLKDISFTDDWDEKEMPHRKIEVYDRWWYD